MGRERDVETVGGSDHEMKPDQILFPMPNQVTDRETDDNQDHVKGKKIGGKSYQEVCFGDNDMTARGSGFELLDLTAEEPGPEDVRQFVAKDIDAHRFGEEEKNDQPTSGAANSGDPNRLSVVGHPDHEEN